MTTSSQRSKDQIKPTDNLGEALFALKPVTFRYKKEVDPPGKSHFGLIAEEVDKVNPTLEVRDNEGKPYSVRYDQVNAMLLNEFLKEHKAFLEQQHKVRNLETTLDAVAKQLNAQEAKIKKLAAQIEASKPIARLASSAPFE